MGGFWFPKLKYVVMRGFRFPKSRISGRSLYFLIISLLRVPLKQNSIEGKLHYKEMRSIPQQNPSKRKCNSTTTEIYYSESIFTVPWISI